MKSRYTEPGSLAVLVSGQIRSCRGVLEELAQLPGPHKTVISVWSKIGAKTDGWLGPGQLTRLLDSAIGQSLPTSLIGFDRLESFLPEFFSTLRTGAQGMNVDAAALSAISPFVDIEDQRLHVEVLPPEARRCNARLIHYKLARALALMQAVEVEQGYRFDLVFRVRPDLQRLPKWSGDIGDDQICLDWYKTDELMGTPSAGDNAILAKRDMLLALCEHMRAAIYDERRGNIHSIIGSFVAANGLKVGQLPTEIGIDQWPVEAFVTCLENKARAEPENIVAGEFLGCIDAYRRLARGDHAGAVAALSRVAARRSLPVLLCEGCIALAQGRLADADRLISEFRTRNGPLRSSDECFFQRRLEELRGTFPPRSHAAAASAASADGGRASRASYSAGTPAGMT